MADKHLKDHMDKQVDLLENEVQQLYPDPTKAQRDLKALKVLKKSIDENRTKDSLAIINALKDKYENMKHHHSPLELTSIIVSIILSVLLSISISLGIYKTIRGK